MSAATARRATIVVVAALAGAFVGCGSAHRARQHASAGALDRDFVGIVAPDVLGTDPGDRRQALDAQHAAGVRVLRQTFDWAQIETRPGVLDFAPYDTLVAAAARSGLDVLPVVFDVPAFDAARARAGADVTPTTTFPPRSPERYARFAQALVRRYGPGGTFWRTNPGLVAHPIRAWQIWNEPNLPVYWGGIPNARAYVALLRAADRAIKQVDPHADVLTAGIPDSKLGIALQTFIRQLYAAGARGAFDTLAVHPYATTAQGVLAGARAARRVAVRAGDPGVHLWITEVGWASGGPSSSFTVTPDRQAQLVTGLLREAARRAPALRLRGVVYYSWRDVAVYPGGQDFWGLHTGMVTRANTVKPALSAFAAAAKAIGARTR